MRLPVATQRARRLRCPPQFGRFASTPDIADSAGAIHEFELTFLDKPDRAEAIKLESPAAEETATYENRFAKRGAGVGAARGESLANLTADFVGQSTSRHESGREREGEAEGRRRSGNDIHRPVAGDGCGTMRLAVKVCPTRSSSGGKALRESPAQQPHVADLRASIDAHHQLQRQRRVIRKLHGHERRSPRCDVQQADARRGDLLRQHHHDRRTWMQAVVEPDRRNGDRKPPATRLRRWRGTCGRCL